MFVCCSSPVKVSAPFRPAALLFDGGLAPTEPPPPTSQPAPSLPELSAPALTPAHSPELNIRLVQLDVRAPCKVSWAALATQAHHIRWGEGLLPGTKASCARTHLHPVCAWPCFWSSGCLLVHAMQDS